MAYIGFDKLAAKVGPAVAASIGRKKYGKKKFDKAAAKGKKLRGAEPSHKMKSGKTMKGASHGSSKPHNVEWLDKHGK